MTPAQNKLLYDLAMSYLHVPYIWGGANPSFGLDCSGLCIEILQSVGVLERGFDATAATLYQSPLFSRADGPEFGDLVFFGPSIKTISHVGFVLGSELMLEAGGGNSSTLSRPEAYKQNARVRIRPIANRKDLIGFRRPKYEF